MERKTSSLRQRLHEATTEAMVDSAEQVMVRNGYDRATMQEIATTAGCATGTLYLHFKNKEELFEAILAKHAQGMYTLGREGMAQSQDPLEKMRLGMVGILGYAQTQKAFFQLFFTAMPMRHRTVERRLKGTSRQAHEDYRELELECLRQAQSQGRVRSDLPAETLQDFQEAVGFNILEQFAFDAPALPVEEQVRILWGLIAGGICGREQP